jgi:hypothetical protein
MINFMVRNAVTQDIKYIDFLQRKNAEELAFYPICVFEREIPANRVLLAEYNNEPCGYLYYGAFNTDLKIHQACIQYDLRGRLYGSLLVGDLLNKAEVNHVSSVHLRCGSDIEANDFWRAMGFYCQAVTKGGARRMRDINAWRKDIQPTMFVDEVVPSKKKKDASKWAKARKAGIGQDSQFLRGAQLKEYRKKIENI